MAQLQWNSSGTRTAEVGVDRGVLFVEGSDVGVAWSGLTRVSRSKPDETLEPIVYDGEVRNVFRSLSATSFQLSALSVPREFSPCLGRVELAPGFYAEDQPIRSFSLVYRTLIANDQEGQEYSYRLNFIFQAYAAERTYTRETVNNQVRVTTRSFDVKAIAQENTNYPPISYISLSPESIAPTPISEVEELIYGTDLTDSTMPSIDELITLLA